MLSNLRININNNNNNNNNPLIHLRVKASQETAGLSFTYLQTEVKDKPARLGAICGQQVKSHIRIGFLVSNINLYDIYH